MPHRFPHPDSADGSVALAQRGAGASSLVDGRWIAATPAIGLGLIVLNAALGPWALGIALVLAAMLLHRNAAALLSLYLFLLLFQNVVIALLLPLVADRPELVTVQGTQFLTLAAFSLVAAGELMRAPFPFAPLRRIVAALLACIVLAGAYFVHGVSAAGFQDAAIYLRTLTVAPLSILLGLFVGSRLSPDVSQRILLFWLGLALLYGLIELVVPRALYDAIGAAAYMTLKQGTPFSGADDVLLYAARPLFNLHAFDEWNLSTLRLSGPNLHTISFAYAMAAGLILFVARRAYFAAALTALLLLPIQAKGPIIALCLSGLFVLCDPRIAARTRAAFVGCALAAYAAGAILYGMRVSDYHVLGLLGGLKGFLAVPLGHGLGSSGNLVALSEDWERFQSQGAADSGTESMIGAMLYQVGIVTLVFLFTYLLLCRVALAEFRERRRNLLILPYAFLIVGVNGLFQEEAYGPFALGLLGLILALYLGWWRRADAAAAREVHDAVSPPPAPPDLVSR